MLKITSRDNQKIKLARKVRDGKVGNLIFVEGLRLAEEALRSNLTFTDIFYTESFSRTERGIAFLQRIEKQNTSEVSENVFNSIADTEHSQGIILISEKPETGKNIVQTSLERTGREFPLFVLLHEINNPSNLGAIFRTCEAAGVSGVILTKNSADVFSPKALRGAMGASFRIPIWNEVDYFEALDWAKQKGLNSVCADINAVKSYTDIDWKKPGIIIFGSEARGLSEAERQKADERLFIPMENDVESLNLAVSCGIILFEAKRAQEIQ